MSKAPMLDPRWRRLARLRTYCNASCVAAVVVGCLVLLGWLFRVELLESGFFHSGAIKPNTALSLILAGVSLWLLLPDPPRASRRRWGLFLAALVAAIGAVTTLEHILRLNLHIDRLFVDHGSAAASLGRMSPIMATTFLSLGLALLLIDVQAKSGWRASQLLSLWGALAGLMSLSGYVNGATAIYKIFSYSPVEVCTSLLLSMISVAVFFARPRSGMASDLTGRFLGSAMARRFLPVVIVIPLLAAWIRVRVEAAGLLAPELGFALNVTVSIFVLCALLWTNARQLNKSEESLEEAREAKDTFYYASLRDELTGLYNSRGFLAFGEEQVRLACSGRRELLVVFADVDGLKAINDQHGHLEGDRALKRAAEVLLAVFRDTDLIARLGGDEFAVLALDCSPTGLVRINAHFEKMLRIVNEPGAPWKLSLSVGALHVDAEHQISVDEVLSKADGIMYEHKRSKRSRIVPVTTSRSLGLQEVSKQ